MNHAKMDIRTCVRRAVRRVRKGWRGGLTRDRQGFKRYRDGKDGSDGSDGRDGRDGREERAAGAERVVGSEPCN